MGVRDWEEVIWSMTNFDFFLSMSLILYCCVNSRFRK